MLGPRTHRQQGFQRRTGRHSTIVRKFREYLKLDEYTIELESLAVGEPCSLQSRGVMVHRVRGIEHRVVAEAGAKNAMMSGRSN